jgi:hypothetical protein
MKSKWTGLGLGAALLLSLSAMTAGTALAASSVDSPGKVQADTTQLNYTGQGTSNGQLNTEQCGDNADPGAGGWQNGATADDYILWIFDTDGGNTNGDEMLNVNGDTYTGGHQVVTPSYDLSAITAFMSFTVGSTGSGDWNLVISHGCIKAHEDQNIAPAATIFGPCADPAYYALFDNSASNVAIKFRMTWFNTHGFNVVSKVVPGGAMYTTFQHWAKPGTMVKVSYKDPNTGLWVNLASLLSVHGSFPACVYTPGWGQPS